MRLVVHTLALIIGFWALGVTPAWAQVTPPTLETIWAAYRQFDYVTAEKLAQTALNTYERPDDLGQVHIILGLVAFSRNEQVEANRQFTDALLLDPNVQLDALQVSPKILDFFEEIRTELEQAQPEEKGDTQGASRYILVPDRRAEAALRSMVVPGWGQLHKGQRTKGRVLLGAWSLTLAGSITAHFLRQQAQNTYLDAIGDEVEEHYDTFNRWHKTRNALLMGAVGVWVYGYLDALITGLQPLRQRNLLITPSFSDRKMHVYVQVRF